MSCRACGIQGSLYKSCSWTLAVALWVKRSGFRLWLLCLASALKGLKTVHAFCERFEGRVRRCRLRDTLARFAVLKATGYQKMATQTTTVGIEQMAAMLVAA